MKREEQLFWSNVKTNMPNGYWAQRVENGLIPGMPDVYLTSPSANTYWVELKAFSRPARHSTPWLSIGEGKGQIRQEQVNWHIKANSMDIESFILCRIDGRLYLVPGEDAKIIHEACIYEWDMNYKIQSWGHLWSILK